MHNKSNRHTKAIMKAALCTSLGSLPGQMSMIEAETADGIQRRAGVICVTGDDTQRTIEWLGKRIAAATSNEPISADICISVTPFTSQWITVQAQGTCIALMGTEYLGDIGRRMWRRRIITWSPQTVKNMKHEPLCRYSDTDTLFTWYVIPARYIHFVPSLMPYDDRHTGALNAIENALSVSYFDGATLVYDHGNLWAADESAMCASLNKRLVPSVLREDYYTVVQKQMYILGSNTHLPPAAAHGAAHGAASWHDTYRAECDHCDRPLGGVHGGEQVYKSGSSVYCEYCHNKTKGKKTPMWFAYPQSKNPKLTDVDKQVVVHMKVVQDYENYAAVFRDGDEFYLLTGSPPIRPDLQAKMTDAEGHPLCINGIVYDSNFVAPTG